MIRVLRRIAGAWCAVWLSPSWYVILIVASLIGTITSGRTWGYREAFIVLGFSVVLAVANVILRYLKPDLYEQDEKSEPSEQQKQQVH
jgi:hypothetical protein